MSALSNAVASLVEQAMLEGGSTTLRVKSDGKEWKVTVDFEKARERMTINIKRRDQETADGPEN